MRAAQVVMGAAALVLAVSACGARSSALGEGPDVDACAGYAIYDGFPEPSPADREELLGYASGMVRLSERIRDDFRIEIEGKDDLVPPADVMDAWKEVGRAMSALRDAVEAAGPDGAAVNAAASSVFHDDAYLAADTRLTDFFIDQCPRRA